MTTEIQSLLERSLIFIYLTVREHGKGYAKDGQPIPETQPYLGITDLRDDLETALDLHSTSCTS